ncbi:hypothetical protein PIIN_01155 [Serendipita indica DSM 11827]|uniref:Uncharacterized protein n=1 Tax=Serendipita indica (strain DSM 11827) TaxID=1109443 RepID=G4T7L7_SERID|nr:hypothetical protein PIIN_01155 [Serendipita indica DSM 11827]
MLPQRGLLSKGSSISPEVFSEESEISEEAKRFAYDQFGGLIHRIHHYQETKWTRAFRSRDFVRIYVAMIVFVAFIRHSEGDPQSKTRSFGHLRRWI